MSKEISDSRKFFVPSRLLTPMDPEISLREKTTSGAP